MAILNLGSCGGGGDKENAPPAPAAARGIIAVKSHTAMKRPGGKAARRRPPLRDITGLFLAAPSRTPPAAALPALAEAELAEAVRARAGSSDGVAAKQGRYSLRKGFR